MAVVVVDVFETVEVDEHQRDAGFGLSRLFQCFGQPLFQHQTIGQTGQRIEVGEVLEVTGRGLFFSDVAHHAHHFDHRIVVVAHYIAGLAQPANRAVGPDHAVFLVMVFPGFQAT